MVQCKKCKLFLSTSKDDVVKCKECENVYHKKCVKKHFLQTEMCGDCQKSSPIQKPQKPILDIDPHKITVETLLVEMNKKLEIIFKLEQKLDDLTETVDFYAEKYQEMIDFKKSAENKIKIIEQRNIYLEKCNIALEERVVRLEKKEKEKNIDIACLQKITENEDIKVVVNKLALKLKLNPADIESVERVGTQLPVADRPRPIVVQLRSKYARDQWLQKRKIHLTNGEIYGTENNMPVYINEDLTKATKQLFYETKTQLKNIYKYIWIQNSSILVKKGENEKITRIKTQNDIKLLYNNVITNM